MLTAHQPDLPLPRALPPQRRDLPPNLGRAPYRLPHEVKDRLASSLAPFRNRAPAHALAVFLGRFWSMPGRVALPFPIDRRALADREDLGLTEAQVRGAIKTLEAVGFIDRWQTTGSKYKATEAGLHRKPIPFTFGGEYTPLFLAANKRAGVARGRQEGARRCPTPDPRQTPPVGFPQAQNLAAPRDLKPSHNSPKGKSEANPVVIMGEVANGFSGTTLVLPAPDPAQIRARAARAQLEAWLAKPPEPPTPLRSSTLAAGRFGRGQSPSR
jgi:hypothetical protein